MVVLMSLWPMIPDSLEIGMPSLAHRTAKVWRSACHRGSAPAFPENAIPAVAMALLIQSFAVPGLMGWPSLRANTHSVTRACERWTSRRASTPEHPDGDHDTWGCSLVQPDQQHAAGDRYRHLPADRVTGAEPANHAAQMN
jgi:hypothetical protein